MKPSYLSHFVTTLKLSVLLSLAGVAAAGALPGGAQQAASAPAPDAVPGSASPSAAAGNARPNAAPVVLPVVVRDKKGALVNNVQKNDLTLTQDGRPQTIESLSKVDTAQALRVGLLVDTSRAVSGALEAERKAAASFVDQVLPAQGGKDQAFLLHFDREVELLEDFTASKDKLHQELDDMGQSSERRDDRQGPETTGDDTSDRKNNIRHGSDQLYDAIFLAADELMKNKDGRKTLVVFSDGADRGSKETMNDAIDAADKAGLTVYTIFFKGEQDKSSYAEYPGQRRGGGWPGGGGGYPGGGGGYPGGGNRRQPEPTSGAGVDGKKIMQEIASRTGGHAYEAKHTGDLEPIYKLIAEEMGAQYLLTYTPDKPDDEGGYHKIALTTNNKDWTVSTREGLYAPVGK